MKCKTCNHNKRHHFVDTINNFLRGKYKGKCNGSDERYVPFACNIVGCQCMGYEK